jgi:hypothetical protein
VPGSGGSSQYFESRWKPLRATAKKSGKSAGLRIG